MPGTSVLNEVSRGADVMLGLQAIMVKKLGLCFYSDATLKVLNSYRAMP